MEGGRGLGWEWGGFAVSMEGAAAANGGGESVAVVLAVVGVVSGGLGMSHEGRVAQS